MFYSVDIDPIYYCQLLNACPIFDTGDATITDVSVTPSTVVYGKYIISIAAWVSRAGKKIARQTNFPDHIHFCHMTCHTLKNQVIEINCPLL